MLWMMSEAVRAAGRGLRRAGDGSRRGLRWSSGSVGTLLASGCLLRARSGRSDVVQEGWR